MAGGLPPAPRWAWVAMGAGVVAIVVLSYLALHRPPPPGFSAPAAAAGTARTTESTRTTQPTPTTAPATTPATTQPTEPAQPISMLVIGDSYTVGGPAGNSGETGWAQLVAHDLTAAGRPVTLEVAGADGGGYVRTGSTGTTFVDLAKRAGANRDLVVFFGSRNDVAAAPDVQAAAEAAFATVRTASPEATILVIGPSWVNGNPPGYIVTDRDAVNAAAHAAGVGFVDPLAEGWFTGDAAAFIGPDGIHPTDQGHRYLADLIRPRIESVLPHGP